MNTNCMSWKHSLQRTFLHYTRGIQPMHLLETGSNTIASQTNKQYTQTIQNNCRCSLVSSRCKRLAQRMEYTCLGGKTGRNRRRREGRIDQLGIADTRSSRAVRLAIMDRRGIFDLARIFKDCKINLFYFASKKLFK